MITHAEMKHVLRSIVIPRTGRPYTRCKVCRAQIFGEGSPRTPLVAIAMALKPRVDKHMEDHDVD